MDTPLVNKVAAALDSKTAQRVGRRLEPRFLVFYICCCFYYFHLQWPSFDLMGNYRGSDPAEKFRRVAEARGANATLEYYRTDRQAIWHQEYYNAMAGGDFFQYGHCAAAYVWWGGMLLQLTGWIRRYVKFHKMVGYASFVAGQLLAFSGFVGLMSCRLDLTHNAYKEDIKVFDGPVRTLLEWWLQIYVITFWAHGIYMSLTGFLYVWHIYNGRRQQHRRWILRHCMVGFATLFKRITYNMWPHFLMYSPVDLHWIPGSVVKATCANVWIYVAHALSVVLIHYKYRGTSSSSSGNVAVKKDQ